MWRELICWFFVSLVSCSVYCGTVSKKIKLKCYQKDPAIQRFREYLRIDTSKQENINEAVQFWRRLASEAGLAFSVHAPRGLPVVLLTWPGAEPSLPSVMLNSHMDVVPADSTEWTYPPFTAHMDDRGDIYGRGAQDTKDVAIAYFQAISMLKDANITLDRTFHITLMPDEETGGLKGMIPFSESEVFKTLNVGFVLDEGYTSATDTLYANYLDKRTWKMKFDVHSVASHGFTMPDGSAMEKAQRLIDVIMKYRETQKAIMKSRPWIDYGSYTSVNINMIQGGIAPNALPAQISLVVDMRLASHVHVDDVSDMIDSWVQAAGNNTTVTYLERNMESLATAMDDTNRYWATMRDTAKKLGVTILPMVCPAKTDMLVLRNKGIPALGFTTKSHTISRLHGPNEYLNAEVLQKGIKIYVEIIKALGKKKL